MIVLVFAHSIGHGKRLMPGQNGGSGIAFLLRGIPVLMIPVIFDLCLTRLHLGFLKTEKIRIAGGKVIHKALAQTGTQTIDVPGDKFHVKFLRLFIGN